MTSTLLFIALATLTFFVMEAAAYLAHRYLFHGVLWFIHRTHHQPRKTWWEWNDVFSLLFGPIAFGLMAGWFAPDWKSFTLPIGVGMTLYGIVYFFIHDMYTHRRFWMVRFENKWLVDMRSAHRHHHSSVTKDGQEPFGFVYFQNQRRLADPSKGR